MYVGMYVCVYVGRYFYFFFLFLLFTTCSITKQYYMFKCSFDSLAVLLIL